MKEGNCERGERRMADITRCIRVSGEKGRYDNVRWLWNGRREMRSPSIGLDQGHGKKH